VAAAVTAVGEDRAGREFVELVDRRTAVISAAGHLTTRGADLLCGTVEVLHRSGHACITVDLHAVGAVDDEAMAELRALAVRLRGRHGQLLLLPGTGPEP
jgi:hypothetical protein